MRDTQATIELAVNISQSLFLLGNSKKMRFQKCKQENPDFIKVDLHVFHDFRPKKAKPIKSQNHKVFAFVSQFILNHRDRLRRYALLDSCQPALSCDCRAQTSTSTLLPDDV